MSLRALMKPAFLVALLLVVSQASALDPLRLLRGNSDQTYGEVDQASKQDLGQGEPPYHQDATSSDVALRQLAWKRHRGHPAKASRNHRMKGTHPSHHRASPGSRTFRHAAVPHHQAHKQRIKGSSHSSPRHSMPGTHKTMEGKKAGKKMEGKKAGTRGNVG